MNVLLWHAISYHAYKEDFYHAFLVGFLQVLDSRFRSKI